MKPLSVADVYVLYLNHIKARNTHGPGRSHSRDRIWREFLERHGRMSVDEDLKPFHLTDFVDAHENWRSTGTRKFAADVIKAPFTWAAKFGRIARSPFACINYEPSGRRPAMPDAVLDKICDDVPKEAERALRWLRFTAARVSEMCRAEWKDVDLRAGLWTIPIHKTVKKTRKPRYVALPPPAVELLELLRDAAVRQRGVAEGPIFLNVRGQRWHPGAIYHVVMRAKERLGIDDPASTHGIRHRFGTAAVAAGAPMKLVAHQMGDTVKTLEDYYVHLDGEIDALRAAAVLGLPKQQ